MNERSSELVRHPAESGLRRLAMRAARLARDERGDAMVETLVAFPTLLFVLLLLHQFGYQCAAHVVLQRAAAASTRAAVVYLAESCMDGAVSRPAIVSAAAARVLFASGNFAPDALNVRIEGELSGFSLVTTVVETQFDCSPFLFGAVLCGADRRLPMTAQASLPYQGF